MRGTAPAVAGRPGGRHSRRRLGKRPAAPPEHSVQLGCRRVPLEEYLQAKLDLPCELLRRQSPDRAEHAGPCVRIRIGLPEVHIVERVEQLRAERPG